MITIRPFSHELLDVKECNGFGIGNCLKFKLATTVVVTKWLINEPKKKIETNRTIYNDVVVHRGAVYVAIDDKKLFPVFSYTKQIEVFGSTERVYAVEKFIDFFVEYEKATLLIGGVEGFVDTIFNKGVI